MKETHWDYYCDDCGWGDGTSALETTTVGGRVVLSAISVRVSS